MKKVLSILGIAVVLAAVGIGIYRSQLTSVNDVMLANIEALANKEEGTPIGKCRRDSPQEGEPGTYYPCDSGTSSEMIYPCPDGSKWGGFGPEDICTK